MAITNQGSRTLFDANGNGAAFTVGRYDTYLLSGQGTFDSGSLKLQVACGLNVAGDTQLWRDWAGFTALTAVGHQAVALPAGSYRWVLSGAGGAPSVAAFAQVS